MKKVAVLLLAAGLVFGAAHKGAQAADIKVSGEWDFNTEWNNIGFAKEKADDLFHARQRLRTQVDIIASESLKGTVFFEVGDTNWGNSSEGGALGTDGKVVEVRYSYVDWVVPQTDLRVRMGLQPFSLPNFVAGDPIMGSDDSEARASPCPISSMIWPGCPCSGCVRKTTTPRLTAAWATRWTLWA